MRENKKLKNKGGYKMSSGVSKNLLALLIIVTILLSVLTTWTVLTKQQPAVIQGREEAQGRVSLTIGN